MLNVVSAIVIIAVVVLLFKGLDRLNRRFFGHRVSIMEYYIFKVSRVTGKSEYDVFFKSAEEWRLSKEKIEKDFKDYLQHRIVPYYVADFIRKNRHHIDELRMPLF
jgi:hypothetical protein